MRATEWRRTELRLQPLEHRINPVASVTNPDPLIYVVDSGSFTRNLPIPFPNVPQPPPFNYSPGGVTGIDPVSGGAAGTRYAVRDDLLEEIGDIEQSVTGDLFFYAVRRDGGDGTTREQGVYRLAAGSGTASLVLPTRGAARLSTLPNGDVMATDPGELIPGMGYQPGGIYRIDGNDGSVSLVRAADPSVFEVLGDATVSRGTIIPSSPELPGPLFYWARQFDQNGVLAAAGLYRVDGPRADGPAAQVLDTSGGPQLDRLGFVGTMPDGSVVAVDPGRFVPSRPTFDGTLLPPVYQAGGIFRVSDGFSPTFQVVYTPDAGRFERLGDFVPAGTDDGALFFVAEREVPGGDEYGVYRLGPGGPVQVVDLTKTRDGVEGRFRLGEGFLGGFQGNLLGTSPLPAISDVSDQRVTAGTSSGPIPFTIRPATAFGDFETVAATSSDPNLLPLGAITLGGLDTDRTVTVTPPAGVTGTAVVTLTVTYSNGRSASDTFVVTVTAPVSPPPPVRTPARLVGVPPFAAAAGSAVTLFNPDGSARRSVSPFPSFAGSIRSASADLDGDGTPDIVAGTGPGAASRVSVIDGESGEERFGIDPFEAAFTGGVFVAAGDIDADGKADLIVTPDEGGGPRVDIYSGATGTKMASFFGIDDPNFRGGARAATGDVNGDGVADLIVSAGFGGGPRIAVFDGKALARGERVKLVNDFFAFETGLRNGAFVAAGDIDGDGFADPIFGGGPGGGPRVLAFSGQALLAGNQSPLVNFFAGDTANRGGIRVSVKDLDADDRADLVVGAGTGAGGRVTAYLGKALTAGNASAVFDLDAGGSNGVFVG